jgi:hypothetical protein
MHAKYGLDEIATKNQPGRQVITNFLRKIFPTHAVTRKIGCVGKAMFYFGYLDNQHITSYLASAPALVNNTFIIVFSNLLRTAKLILD